MKVPGARQSPTTQEEVDPGWLQHRQLGGSPSYGSHWVCGQNPGAKKGKTLSKKFAIKYFNASGQLEGGWVGFEKAAKTKWREMMFSEGVEE